MVSLLDWLVDKHPEQTVRAGTTVLVDIALVRLALDRAEASGVSLVRMQGFAVGSTAAMPLDGEIVEAQAMSLLDCETPSGASCGAARRAVAGSWSSRELAPGSRHMVTLQFDDEVGGPEAADEQPSSPASTH